MRRMGYRAVRDIMSCWMSCWTPFARWGTMSQRTPCGVKILRSHQPRPRTRPQYLRPVPASVGHVSIIVADSRAGPCVKWAVLQHVVLCCNMLCCAATFCANLHAVRFARWPRSRQLEHAQIVMRGLADERCPPHPAPPRPTACTTQYLAVLRNLQLPAVGRVLRQLQYHRHGTFHASMQRASCHATYTARRAVAHLHDLLIVHRDIKPENCFERAPTATCHVACHNVSCHP